MGVHPDAANTRLRQVVHQGPQGLPVSEIDGAGEPLYEFRKDADSDGIVCETLRVALGRRFAPRPTSAVTMPTRGRDRSHATLALGLPGRLSSSQLLRQIQAEAHVANDLQLGL